MLPIIDKRIYFGVVLTAVSVLAVLGFIFDTIPARDLALRYAPMSEAFASGDWQFAFHPRIQPLQTVCGGIIAWIFQCNGFVALKIATLLWFAGGAVLVWKLFKEVYPDKQFAAWGATVFYILYPYNVHMAYSGLRESSKTFVLLLAALALVKISRNISKLPGYMLLGISCFMAMFCRVDMIMTGVAVLFTGMVLECRNRKFPLYSLLPCFITAGGICLNSFLNYRVAGVAMPDYRVAGMFIKVFGRAPVFLDALFLSMSMVFATVAGAFIMALMLRKIHVKYFLITALVFAIVLSVKTAISGGADWEFFESVLKGIYHAVGIFSFAVIIYLVYCKRLGQEEFLLILLLFYNMFFCIVPMLLFNKILYVSARYLYVAVPLLAGFFVLGINEIYCYLQHHMQKKYADWLLLLACTAITAAFIFHASEPCIKECFRKKNIRSRKGIETLASEIRKNYTGPEKIDRKIHFKVYRSNKAPVVLFERSDDKIAVAAYLAGGTVFARDYGSPDFFVGKTLPSQYCKRSSFISTIKIRKDTFNLWKVKK